MERGELVPDDDHDRRCSSNDSAAATRRRARSSTASRATATRPRRSTARSPSATPWSTGPSSSRSRPTSSSGACPAAGSAGPTATSTTSASIRPARPGICDIDGSALYQRDDDRPETIRARLAQQLGALGDVVAYYRDRGVLGTVDGTAGVPEVTAALVAEVGAVPKGA